MVDLSIRSFKELGSKVIFVLSGGTVGRSARSQLLGAMGWFTMELVSALHWKREREVEDP